MDRTPPFDLPLAALPDCVFRTDLSLRLQAVSPAAVGMFGIPAAALVGAPLADLVTADDHARLQELVRQTLGQTDRTVSLLHQIRVRHADGRLIPVELHSRLLLGDHGEPVGVIGVARDLTARLRQDAAAREREHRRLQEQKHAALARLAGRVADDLRPLLQTLARCPEAADSPELAPLRASARDRLRQLEQVAGRLTCHRHDVDVDRAVAAIVADLGRDLPAGLTLTHEPGSEGTVAALDRDLLARALEALVANARTALPGGGQISVRTAAVPAAMATPATPTAPAHPRVRISVHDSGPGLSATARERAGEPYYSTTAGAAGLGLSLVRSVARLHDGHLELETDPDRGTTVTLELPARYTSATAAEDAAPATPSGARPTVLVVDDDPEILRYVERVLRAARLQVVPCSDGVDALAYLSGGEAVDAVVLDWALPGLDGRRVREQVLRRQPRIPLLVISGHVREEYEALGGVDTGTPWLVKPFTPGELRAAVSALLRRRAEASGS